MHTYNYEGGRAITRDGAPFVYVSRSIPEQPGAADPCAVDAFARLSAFAPRLEAVARDFAAIEVALRDHIGDRLPIDLAVPAGRARELLNEIDKSLAGYKALDAYP